MARLFISHSSANNAAAIALCKWLTQRGFDDVFLDIDPGRGLVAGQRWQEALRAAADRCEAVLFLVSPAWVASKWCQAEFLLAKTLHKRIFGLIVEPVSTDSIPVEMTAEWQVCRLVGEDPLQTFEVTVGAQHETVAFREAGLDLLWRGLERAGLDARSFPWPPAGDPKRAPYPGLRALEAEDAAIFFGRDATIVRGLDRIRGLTEGGIETLLVLLGASGSGKSSFLRAGIWPRLMRDDLSFLPLPVIRPQNAVITGSAGLACALASAFERLGAFRPPGRIKEALGAEGGLESLFDELSGLATSRLVAPAEQQRQPTLVFAIDQAEELFLPEGADEASVFLRLIAGVLASPAGAQRRVLCVATIRSDRYQLLQAEPSLSAVKQDLFNLPPLPPAEFKSVIEGPARRVVQAGGHLAIDPALTERLIADAQGADALPLLAFTLERLYADFGDGNLTLAEYQKLGGVQGSIEQAIAQALAGPTAPPAIPADRQEQLACLRAAFIPWLARVEPDSGAPMRRVARRDEIPDHARAIVQRFIAARLLTADRRGGVDVVEVAHESLLRQWPVLTGWLQADADDLKLAEGVDHAAGEWTRNNRQDAWLDHRAERLAAAEKVAQRDDFRKRLGEEGMDYLRACRMREDAERAEKEAALGREQARLAQIAAAQANTARLQRRARWTLALLALVIAAATGIASWQTYLRERALAERRVDLLVELAEGARQRGQSDGALRFAVHAAQLGARLGPPAQSAADAELAALSAETRWLILRGHTDKVTSGTFSPDGTRIVTCSLDGTARIWDAVTGREIATLQGHGKLLSAAFSADGTRVVTASTDKTAVVWDAATTRPIAVLQGHGNAVTSASFSRDGTRIVTASADATARVWDAVTGRQIGLLRGHEAEITSAEFSPDGRHILTASNDTTARIWDANAGTQLAVLRGHRAEVASAHFDPDGSRILTASYDRTARIWDAATGKEILALHGHDYPLTAAVFSPDGSRVVTSSEEVTRIWDAASGIMLVALRGNDSVVDAAGFSPDGARVVVSSWDGTARIWDTGLQKEVVILRGHEDQLFGAAFSPDGTRVATASSDETARIWDAGSGNQISILGGHKGRLFTARFDRDGSRLVTASADGTARIWDVASGKTIATLTGHRGFVYSAAFSPDGSRVVTASNDRTAIIWDAATGAPITALRGHGDLIWTAEWSPDGSRIVTSSWDHTARIWDAASGQQIRVLSGHEDTLWTAAWSPDGSRIITSSHDKTARIWDATSGRTIAVLRRGDSYVTAAVFSPDGTRVATVSSDKTVRIWDAATATELAVLRGHADEVRRVAFSPHGSRIVTASQDKTARIWSIRSVTTPGQELTGSVCAQQLRGISIFTREEMHLAGYPDTTPNIDLCGEKN